MTSISELDLFHLLRSLKCMTSFYEQGYKQNQMQQNQKKTKLMLFDPSRNRDFLSQL